VVKDAKKLKGNLIMKILVVLGGHWSFIPYSICKQFIMAWKMRALNVQMFHIKKIE
jgi:hypothetical protein